MNWIRACTCVVAVAVLLYMRMCGARAFSVLHGNALACFCLSCMGLCLLVVCLCVAQGLSVKAGAKSNRKSKSKTQKQNPESVTVTSLSPPSLAPFPSPFPSPVLPGSLCSGGDHAHHLPRSSGGGTWCCALFLPAAGTVPHPPAGWWLPRVGLAAGAPVAAWPPAPARLPGWEGRLASAEEGQGRAGRLGAI